LRISE
jgi:hypothetical protein